jgi:drug/metabolite transporter (DMT)-like permease
MQNESTPRPSFDRFAPLFVIWAATLWGIDGILLRPSLYSLPVPLVVMIETSIVAVILTPLFLRNIRQVKVLKRKDWLAFAGVAIFGGVVGSMSITRALFYVNFVNLSIVILIQKLQPLFALILARIILKERLPMQFFGWGGLAFVGAYLMTFGTQMPVFDTGDKTTIAAIFALIAAFSFGSSTVLSKRALRNVSFELGTYLRFTATALIMIIINLFMGSYSAVTEINRTQILVFLLIAFTTGGPAIFMYYYGLQRISASVATICEMAFPLSAVLLEYLLRDNILEPVQWGGVLLLFAGILRITSFNRKVVKNPGRPA